MSSRSVPVQLDRPRHLKFSFNALADMQDGDQLIFMRDEQSLPAIRRYLWGGLKHEDPTLTIEKSGVILEEWLENGGNLKDLAKKIREAIDGSIFIISVKRGQQADPSVPEGAEPLKNSDGPGSNS